MWFIAVSSSHEELGMNTKRYWIKRRGKLWRESNEAGFTALRIEAGVTPQPEYEKHLTGFSYGKLGLYGRITEGAIQSATWDHDLPFLKVVQKKPNRS